MRGTVLLLLVFGLVSPAAAQPSAGYLGRPVEELGIFVENTPTADPVLLDLVETRVGRPLSMADVRESIAHLYSLGRFQDIQVEALEAAGGGVRLRFLLVSLRSVERVEFSGTLGLPQRQLRGVVTDRYGSTLSIGRAEDVARTLRQYYADHGYLRARVEPIAPAPGAEDTLRFEIDAGPLARIGRVDIEGEPRSSRPALLRRLNAAPGDPYRRRQLRERLDVLQRDLRRQGFYQATTTFRPMPSEDLTTVDLVLGVRPGPMVRIRFEGDRLPQDRLDALVPVRREGSVDEDLLEDSETRLETYLRREGYWKAEVSVRRNEGEGTLGIIFDVRRGMQYRLAEVEIRGNSAVPLEELRPLVPLQTGGSFSDAQLTVGVAAIREHYLRRGFARVAVKSATNETDPVSPGEGRIRAEVVVTEGPRVQLGTVRVAGNTALSDAELTALIQSRPGTPYYAPQASADRDEILRTYLNLGYAAATVGVVGEVPEDETPMDLLFQIEEGPQTIVDRILVVGNVNTDQEVILRELQLRSGRPLGAEALFESQRRLSALGLFRRVRITELTHGSTNRHDILVTVEEAPATTIGYGGGLEVTPRLREAGPGGEAEERLEFAPRGFFDIGRRNLWGKNRSINLYTRVSLRPNDAPDDPGRDGRGIGFSEYRVVGSYRQPRVLGPNDLTLTAAVEQGIRSTFKFSRKGVIMDAVRHFRPALRVSARYAFSTTRRFDERLSEEDQATIDRLFPQVRLSTVAGAVAHDTRDDLLDPERGMFLSAEGSVALRNLGGQVGFMKTYSQALWFRRLPGSRRVVFATRAGVGLADGFEREVLAADGTATVIEDLPASERFFAGGDTTIRGYSLDAVGAPDTITPRGFPTGGNAVLLLSGELRVPVWRSLGTAVFVDGGNVFRRVTDFDLGELRGSVGFGLRYRSPIGPIRVDLGFKLDPREIGGSVERPTALHFSIGQAF